VRELVGAVGLWVSVDSMSRSNIVDSVSASNVIHSVSASDVMCWLRVDAEQLHIITGVSSRGGGGGRVGCGAGACREALNNRRNEASAWMRLRVIALLMTRILTLPPPLPKIQGERNWEREKEKQPLPQHQEQQRDELAKRLREHSALVWKVVGRRAQQHVRKLRKLVA